MTLFLRLNHISLLRNHNLICRESKNSGPQSDTEFDFQHGNELYWCNSPSCYYWRRNGKIGDDVVNGPYADDTTQLIIVDDRFDPFRANKMGILSIVELNRLPNCQSSSLVFRAAASFFTPYPTKRPNCSGNSDWSAIAALSPEPRLSL